ncbi:MAG TPA: magnesium/cobalt transporter CorA [Conexibacter sp.]
MIVDCAVYEQGQRRLGELELEEAAHCTRDPGSFAWLGVVEPTPEEFNAIAREFDLHELAVEDAVDAHQRPKLEVYGETLLVVVKTAHYDEAEENVHIGELLVFVNQQFVITVRHGDGPLTGVRERLQRRPDLLRLGPSAVLYAILDRVVDAYDATAEQIDEAIQSVEAQVFSDQRDNPAERIYRLARELQEFHRAVVPLLSEVDQLARGNVEVVAPELTDYYRDAHDHLRRVCARVTGFRDLLSSALQANMTQVAVRQNEDMRMISAWVAILAVPTLVAAIYGMNFDNMPELHWQYGYPLVLAVVFAGCAVLYRRFKRAGWL